MTSSLQDRGKRMKIKLWWIAAAVAAVIALFYLYLFLTA